MHRAALHSLGIDSKNCNRSRIAIADSKIVYLRSKNQIFFFSFNEDIIIFRRGGNLPKIMLIYRWRTVYLRKRRFNLITNENISTTRNVLYVRGMENVILRVVRVIKTLVLDGLSGFTWWNLFPEKKCRPFLERKKKKKLRFKRFDRSCYQEQENFFSASVYEVTNAWNIDSIDSNVSSLGLL